jgi:hypothetical protein
LKHRLEYQYLRIFNPTSWPHDCPPIPPQNISATHFSPFSHTPLPFKPHTSPLSATHLSPFSHTHPSFQPHTSPFSHTHLPFRPHPLSATHIYTFGHIPFQPHTSTLSATYIYPFSHTHLPFRQHTSTPSAKHLLPFSYIHLPFQPDISPFSATHIHQFSLHQLFSGRNISDTFRSFSTYTHNLPFRTYAFIPFSASTSSFSPSIPYSHCYLLLVLFAPF